MNYIINFLFLNIIRIAKCLIRNIHWIQPFSNTPLLHGQRCAFAAEGGCSQALPDTIVGVCSCSTAKPCFPLPHSILITPWLTKPLPWAVSSHFRLYMLSHEWGHSFLILERADRNVMQGTSLAEMMLPRLNRYVYQPPLYYAKIGIVVMSQQVHTDRKRHRHGDFTNFAHNH